jgi:hypothetical protein
MMELVNEQREFETRAQSGSVNWSWAMRLCHAT